MVLASFSHSELADGATRSFALLVVPFWLARPPARRRTRLHLRTQPPWRPLPLSWTPFALGPLLLLGMNFLNESKRRVNLGGSSASAAGASGERATLLEQARQQRLARQQEKQREQAAHRIQVSEGEARGTSYLEGLRFSLRVWPLPPLLLFLSDLLLILSRAHV